jgi:hypothetical protein
MRFLFHFLATFAGCALAMSAVPVSAAPTCSSPADQSVYEVLALREQMQLLATAKCQRDKEYNQYFIIRFRPILQANDRAVLAYFRRTYGGAGQGRMDSFDTELISVMSQQANTQAAEFCSRAGLIINEMNALRTMDELAEYAAVKDLTPPGVSMCPVGAAPGPAASRRRGYR